MRRAYDTPAYRAAKKRLNGLPCHWCGRVSDTVDHLIPVAAGGTNSAENLVPACKRCNSRRGAQFGNRRRARRRRFRWDAG